MIDQWGWVVIAGCIGFAAGVVYYAVVDLMFERAERRER